MTVLLVDDSRLFTISVSKALTSAGYSVITAADGEEGLRMARDKIPDVILLDLLLPKMGGPQVLQELKRDVKTAHIPVIVLSSLSQKNEAKLKEEGAAAYFEKTTQNPETLVQSLKNVLKESKQRES